MISAFVTLLARLVLGVATAVFVLVLLSLALFAMLALALWSLVRGRKPVVDVSGLRRASQFRAGRDMARRPMGEVVDVEVREVPQAKS
ncbi:hypothetical protein [Roseateles koreensis]|uniref:Uncharacterized protein n=1 Tax=Roseateles koreensis TaxID=2987526 RepID=A0ABT5KW88_9BURK|nr:hypothetical protein [Roseateles koreensis]MDC8787198.1 hypothetical protein [Roseateles koreensis]